MTGSWIPNRELVPDALQGVGPGREQEPGAIGRVRGVFDHDREGVAVVGVVDDEQLVARAQRLEAFA